jgi:hypothetical protein
LDISEIAAQCRLAKGGQFVLRTFRQSGKALSTFRRAKVDLITIVESSEKEFSFRRAVPDFRGRNEGKRLCWIEIHRVEDRSGG